MISLSDINLQKRYRLIAFDIRPLITDNIRANLSNMEGTKRTAILVRCSSEQADLIRRAAKAERRTISGFVLVSVQNRIKFRHAYLVPQEEPALVMQERE